MYLTEKGHIHLVGIGGIGMSAIATILKKRGYSVSGCDADNTQSSIHSLRANGCIVSSSDGQKPCIDQSTDLVIYSTAISPQHSDITYALNRAIPVMHRAAIIAWLMNGQIGIAVAGSHGKTTTSALIAHILIQADYDPSIIIGGIMNTNGSNARYGKSSYLVVEADESDRSFLQLHPTHAVITNIDYEHVETYTDLNDLVSTFKKFLDQLQPTGSAYLCLDDEPSKLVLDTYKKPQNIVTFGLDRNAKIRAQDITLQADSTEFSLVYQNNTYNQVTFNLPGMHNVYNALAACAVAHQLNIPFSVISDSLRTFQGVHRRFCYHHTYQGAELFHDYGHHPTEIECTLRIASKRATRKLCVVFQPHRYTRTHGLWQAFIDIFLKNPVDRLIITDIYAAGEPAIMEISSKQLVAALRLANPLCSIDYIPWDKQYKELIKGLRPWFSPGNLILLLGAGDIYKLADHLV